MTVDPASNICLVMGYWLVDSSDFSNKWFVLFAGREDWCDIVLNKFKWGHSFKDLNLELLKKYQACSSSAEVIAVQTEHMKALDEEAENDTRGTFYFHQRNRTISLGSYVCVSKLFVALHPIWCPELYSLLL